VALRICGVSCGPSPTTSARARDANAFASGAPRTAVLPFANLTGDATKEYLGDGMAEELINTLSKVQGLKCRHVLPPW
jgi:adenylate cyclase